MGTIGYRIASSIERQHIWTTVLLGVFTICILPIWINRFPPFYDYYQWVFQARLLALAIQSPVDFGQHYSLVLAPIPNSGFSIIILAVSHFINSPEVLTKVFFTLSAVLFVFGGVFLIRTLQEKASWLDLLPFLWVFNMFAYNGFLSYHFSLGAFFVSLGCLHRLTSGGRHAPSQYGTVLLAVLSVITFLIHLFGWLSFAVALCVYAGFIWRRTRSLDQPIRALITLMPSIILLITYMAFRSQGTMRIELYQSIPNKLFSFIGPLLLFFRIDPFDISAPFPLILNTVILLLIAIIVFWSGVQERRKTLQYIRSEPLIVACVLLLIATIIPFSWFAGLGRPDERFVLPAVILLFGAIGSTHVRWQSAVSIGATLCFVLASNYQVMRIAGEKLLAIQTAVENNLARQQVLSVNIHDISPLRSSCEQASILDGAFGITPTQWFVLNSYLLDGVAKISVFETALISSIPSALAPDLRMIEFDRKSD